MQMAPEKFPPSQWMKLVFVYILIPGILLACAGNWGWWQAWVYSGMVFAAGIVGRA